MIRTFACLLVSAVFSATPVTAQTSVRLQVHTESWLGSTPLDVRAELVARLQDADIAVTDAADAPLVSVWYEEVEANERWPYLIPGTRITFRTEIKTRDGLSTSHSSNIEPPQRTGRDIVSALELRQDAIDAFKLKPDVVMFGYRAGGALGIASSFRQLLEHDDSSTRDFWLSVVIFSKLLWSSETDDLFARVIDEETSRIHRNHSQCSAGMMNHFLKRNLVALQSSVSAEMQGPLLAIDFVAECGNAESIPILKELLTHPVLGARALAAVQRIEERLASSLGMSEPIKRKDPYATLESALGNSAFVASDLLVRRLDSCGAAEGIAEWADRIAGREQSSSNG